LAVMMDTIRPLYVGLQALQIEDRDYHLSWRGGSGD
jgi:homogentisate 1,2-dioxygenase